MSTPFNSRTIRQMMAILLPAAQVLRNQQHRRTAIGVALIGPLFALILQGFRAVLQPQFRTLQAVGDALLVGGLFTLGLVVLLSVGYQLGWMLVQFQPTHVGLLPHLRRRLVWAAALPTLGLPLLFSIGVSLSETQQPEPLIWLAGVTAILIWFITMRNQVVGIRLVLAWLLSVWATQTGPMQTLTKELQNAPGLVALAGLACTVLTLRWVLNTRGDHYLDTWKVLADTFKGHAGQVPRQGKALPAWRRFTRYVLWHMQRSTRSDANLFCYATGPNLHWSSFSTRFIWLGIGMLALLEAERFFADAMPVALVIAPALWLMFLPLTFISQVADFAKRVGQQPHRAGVDATGRTRTPCGSAATTHVRLRASPEPAALGGHDGGAGGTALYNPRGNWWLPLFSISLSLLPALMWFIHPQLIDTARSTNQTVTKLLTWWLIGPVHGDRIQYVHLDGNGESQFLAFVRRPFGPVAGHRVLAGRGGRCWGQQRCQRVPRHELSMNPLLTLQAPGESPRR